MEKIDLRTVGKEVKETLEKEQFECFKKGKNREKLRYCWG